MRFRRSSAIERIRFLTRAEPRSCFLPKNEASSDFYAILSRSPRSWNCDTGHAFTAPARSVRRAPWVGAEYAEVLARAATSVHQDPTGMAAVARCSDWAIETTIATPHLIPTCSTRGEICRLQKETSKPPARPMLPARNAQIAMSFISGWLANTGCE